MRREGSSEAHRAGGIVAIRQTRPCLPSPPRSMMGSFRLAPPGHRAPSPLYVKTHASSMSSMDPTGSPSTRTNGNSFLPPFLRFQSFLASSSPATCVCHIVR